MGPKNVSNESFERNVLNETFCFLELCLFHFGAGAGEGEMKGSGGGGLRRKFRAKG